MPARSLILANLVAAASFFVVLLIPVPEDRALLQLALIVLGLAGAAFFVRRAKRLARRLPNHEVAASGDSVVEGSYARFLVRSWLLPTVAVAGLVYVVSQLL